MAEFPPPSTLTWLNIAARVLYAITIRLLTLPIRLLNWRGAPTIIEDLFFTAVRTLLSHSNLAVFRAIFKPTASAYQEFCTKTGQKARSLTVQGAQAHWIGDENADVVVLYLHGGGYVCPASPDHFTYLSNLEKAINTHRIDGGAGRTLSISFLVLEYSLAPAQAVFPAPLREAALTLSHLLTSSYRLPSQIMLAGDSAGGALVIALLSHIVHSKAGIPKVELMEPLRGAVVLSPWVSFDTTFDSYTRNAESDTLTASVMRMWAAMYLGEIIASNERAVTWPVQSNDVYAEALLAQPAWWSGVDNVVDSMLVWFGRNEVLRDPIVEFVSKMKEGWKAGGGLDEGVLVVEGRDEPHIGPILSVSMGKSKTSSQVAVEMWFLDQLGAGKASSLMRPLAP
ncbi:alpha/beta-hydrolase [Bimuria novae-zelandiae CBS 107.79]|uniref:Alpha/beta-hydrolase n=1 Tax=Bimuria novae-zelandiae CBS 107.79 TaxID=1447943 RepID=A0A6A5UUR4_9PLEO|nr:alpha/beta-hydrolase [Bimuria novae-zelandiae CBS 107.79]